MRWKILLAFTSAFFSLLVAEGLIRLFDPFGVSYFEESTRYHFDKVPDPVLVFKHAPGLRRTYQGVGVSINSLGLRDRELENKRNGEMRILLLGDSVTFGWGVPIEATFGRKMEPILSAKLHRPVRTINSGVGSYNTVQEYSFLKMDGDIIKPDAVVLLYVDNDIEINRSFDPSSQNITLKKSPLKNAVLLLQKSYLYRLLVYFAKYSNAQGPASLSENEPGTKASLDSLGGIARYCKDRRIPFVTFFYRPRKESPSFAAFHDKELAAIQEAGKKYDFPVCETGSWWGNRSIRSVTNSIIDSHPNKTGHEILAQGMAEFLEGRIKK